MTHIDPNDPRHSYRQIADDLRRRIASGELLPGARVEPARQLAARYGVAAMTVDKAIKELKNEGLVQSWQGRGTFVRGGGQQFPEDLATTVHDLRTRLDALATESASTDDQLAELRSQLARARAQIIELYAHAGLAYSDQDAPANSVPGRRRREPRRG
jgi:DNA-binding GntR family transcriptional regulator